MDQCKEGFQNHVVQYPKEYSLCTGCKTCEIVCSLVHEGVVRPSYRRITCQDGNWRTMLHTILSCQHCEDHPCYDACPKSGKAMCIDENNIVYVNEEECIGCGKCAKACKFEPSRIIMTDDKDIKQRKAKKCDLCRTREEGPACIQYCASKCLGLSEDPMPTIEATTGA